MFWWIMGIVGVIIALISFYIGLAIAGTIKWMLIGVGIVFGINWITKGKLVKSIKKIFK